LAGCGSHADCLPGLLKGAGQMKYNVIRIGVGSIGDFDKSEFIQAVADRRILPKDYWHIAGEDDDFYRVESHELYGNGIRKNRTKKAIDAAKAILFIFTFAMTATAYCLKWQSAWMILPWTMLASIVWVNITSAPDASVFKSALYLSAIPYLFLCPVAYHTVVYLGDFIYAPSDRSFHGAFLTVYFLGTVLIYFVCLAFVHAMELKKCRISHSSQKSS